MSGLVKGVKKVFKKVTNFVKDNWKYIVGAVAVYFTAGVALSYFGSTAAFASSMPGFGVGGIFSKAAAFIGFNGSASVASGLSMTSGAFGAGTSAAGMIVPAGTTAAEAAAVFEPVIPTASKIAVKGGADVMTNLAAKAAGKEAVGGVAGGVSKQVVTQTVGQMSAQDAMMKAASTAFKLQSISMLANTAAGLFAESPSETYEKQHALQYGQAFGVGRGGDPSTGWMAQGGSRAFAGMGGSPVPQSQPAGPEGGGSTFLQAPYQAGDAQANPQMADQQEFIQGGYANKGYMPYAA